MQGLPAVGVMGNAASVSRLVGSTPPAFARPGKPVGASSGKASIGPPAGTLTENDHAERTASSKR